MFVHCFVGAKWPQHISFFVRYDTKLTYHLSFLQLGQDFGTAISMFYSASLNFKRQFDHEIKP